MVVGKTAISDWLGRGSRGVGHTLSCTLSNDADGGVCVLGSAVPGRAVCGRSLGGVEAGFEAANQKR
jgi:hypothetical protein